MDEAKSDQNTPVEPPFFQRLYDSPFVLLGIGMVVMLLVYTFWGLWEITSLPTATLP